MLEQDEDEGEDAASVSASASSTGAATPHRPNAILFHSASSHFNRPGKSPELNEWLLTVYKDRVDPIFKPLHWPTAISQIRSQIESPSNEIAALECAIHFTATCALFESERDQRGISVESLLQDTESALVRAGLLTTTSTILLQAFVIYLVGVAHPDKTTYCKDCTLLS